MLGISTLVGVHPCMVAWSRSAAALIVGVIVVGLAVTILDIAVRSRIGPATIVMAALVVMTPLRMAVLSYTNPSS